ncbi:MAG: MmcQ/YjbR family DNA-binding protein [Bacteroidota bacterium]|nr:MmcQ/YjbR family DNA-binding protein [Bacteroidota bacterium]
MNIEQYREYCISKPGVTEEFPFDENTLVFKVLGKMFSLTDVDLFNSINLKCDPDEAVLLREQYPAVQPGYHMNKKHWNTIIMDGSIPDQIIFTWIDNSYDLVYKALPLSKKKLLKKPL